MTAKKILHGIKQVLRAIDDFQHWLFNVGTRVIEVGSGTLLIFYSLDFLFGYTSLILHHPYRMFAYMQSPLVWLGVAALGVLQLIAAGYHSTRSNQTSALLLICAGVVFTFIATAYAIDGRPLSPSFFTYSLIALACLMGGRESLKINKKIEDRRGDN